MKVEMLSFIDRQSPIHSLRGATKLLCFLMWTVAVMLTYDTRVLVVLFALSIIIFLVSRVKLREVGFVLGLILFFLFLNTLLIYVFSPQEGVKIYGSETVLLEGFGRYNVTAEQLFYLFNITLKYVTVIPAALLFIVTTHPSEFASSLNRIGVNYKIAFAVAIALRYIPDVQKDFRTIAIAQQAKGIDLSSKEKLGKRIKNTAAIIVPLIYSSLDRIETISNVMELRGFGKHKKRTWYSTKPFCLGDYLVVCLVVFLLVASLVITFYDGNRFYNPWK